MKDQMANSNEVFKCFLGDFSAWFCSVRQTIKQTNKQTKTPGNCFKKKKTHKKPYFRLILI